MNVLIKPLHSSLVENLLGNVLEESANQKSGQKGINKRESVDIKRETSNELYEESKDPR